MSTIFTKIINRELPATIVYEDDIVIAFLDINPINHGHTLVVPKAHSADARSTEPEVLGHLIKVGQKIALACTEGLGCDGVNFLMNAGEAAGQDVFHTHLHIIPRYANDGRTFDTSHTKYGEGEATVIAQKIQSVL